MQVQVRTDNHIPNSAELVDRVRDEVEGALAERYHGQIRRVDVHIQDLNGHKHGVDKRCTIEVNLDGHGPVAAENKSVSVDDAVSGAVDKVLRGLEHTLGRLRDKGGRVSMSGEET